MSFCISYILPLLSTTGLHLVLYRLHTQHREYDCSFMLPEIILFPPTSIGHAHVFSSSHHLPQALNIKYKVKLIKLKKDMERSLLLKRWGWKEELNCYSLRDNWQSCQVHQTLKKNMSSKKSLDVRNKFEEDLTKLLDIDQKIFLRTEPEPR